MRDRRLLSRRSALDSSYQIYIQKVSCFTISLTEDLLFLNTLYAFLNIINLASVFGCSNKNKPVKFFPTAPLGEVDDAEYFYLSRASDVASRRVKSSIFGDIIITERLMNDA